jgi:hypothetical protein
MINVLKINNMEKAGLLLAAMIHDVDHPYMLVKLEEKTILS